MNGKVVLVTGANGGLGAYVTRAFLETGATLIGTSRKIQQSDFSSPNFAAMPAEISSREGARVLVDRIFADFGKLDVLAHTVGGFAGGQSIAGVDSGRRTMRSGGETCLLFKLQSHAFPQRRLRESFSQPTFLKPQEKRCP